MTYTSLHTILVSSDMKERADYGKEIQAPNSQSRFYTLKNEKKIHFKKMDQNTHHTHKNAQGNILV